MTVTVFFFSSNIVCVLAKHIYTLNQSPVGVLRMKYLNVCCNICENHFCLLGQDSCACCIPYVVLVSVSLSGHGKDVCMFIV